MLPQSASMVHNDTNLSVYPMDVNCKDLVAPEMFSMVPPISWFDSDDVQKHRLISYGLPRNTGFLRDAIHMAPK